jgi:hypothetical protein
MEVVHIIPRHDTLSLYKFMRFLQDDGWSYDGHRLVKGKIQLVLETYADRDAETGEISAYMVNELMKPQLAIHRQDRGIKIETVLKKHAGAPYPKPPVPQPESRLESPSDAEKPKPMSDEEVAAWAEAK